MGTSFFNNKKHLILICINAGNLALWQTGYLVEDLQEERYSRKYWPILRKAQGVL